MAQDEPHVSVGGPLGQDFGTSFGNCVAHAKEGKVVGAFSGINTHKGRNILDVVRNFDPSRRDNP
jgi:hypothetical protein